MACQVRDSVAHKVDSIYALGTNEMDTKWLLISGGFVEGFYTGSHFPERNREGGRLLLCEAPGCERVYHLRCLEPPLARLPPNDAYWVCPDCSSTCVAPEQSMLPQESHISSNRTRR